MSDDPLAPMRGLVNGVILSTLIWIALISLGSAIVAIARHLS